MVVQGWGKVAENLRRATVQISAGGRGQGSGIVVKPEGIIVTNAHVVRSSSIQVGLWDGSSLQATLLSRDPGRDLAILRVPSDNLSAAAFTDSDNLQVGELVMAVGNPLGFIGALSTGVVHAIGRVPGLGPIRWIQTDVRLAPGNSGGPLANARGQVVGVNTMVSRGLGLAVPSNNVTRLLGRNSLGPRLGVVVRPVQVTTLGTEQLGLVILDVINGSPAETSSLMMGDILIGAEGRALRSLEDLEQALDGAGERVVRLQFLRGRGSNARTVAVRLGFPNIAAA